MPCTQVQSDCVCIPAVLYPIFSFIPSTILYADTLCPILLVVLGGKKLLQNFESLISDHGVENAGNELKNSYKNLREYGNLASAAIIFILGDVCRETKKDAIYFMAMGPGVCLEYGGMKRYRAGAKRTASRAAADSGSNLTPLLMAIIVLLVAFIVGGYTVNDLKNML